MSPLRCGGSYLRPDGPGLSVDGLLVADVAGEGQVGGGVSRDEDEHAGAHGLLLGRVAMHVLWHFRHTGTFSPDAMVTCNDGGMSTDRCLGHADAMTTPPLTWLSVVLLLLLRPRLSSDSSRSSLRLALLLHGPLRGMVVVAVRRNSSLRLLRVSTLHSSVVSGTPSSRPSY